MPSLISSLTIPDGVVRFLAMKDLGMVLERPNEFMIGARSRWRCPLSYMTMNSTPVKYRKPLRRVLYDAGSVPCSIGFTCAPSASTARVTHVVRGKSHRPIAMPVVEHPQIPETAK